VRELLAFLEVADNEFKPIMTSQIGIAADRFAPNKRWHVDTMLRVLKLAGNYVKEQILASFVRLIATTPDLQTYCAQKLYAALRDDVSQEGLNLAGAWVIGEFGDALMRGGSYEEEELVKEVRENEIVDLLSTILNSSYSSQIVTQYIITAAMKLTTRLQDPAQVDRLRRLLLSRQTDLDVEIQQRAVEYGNLFGYDQVRRGVLERMPAPEIREEQRVLGEATNKKRHSKVPAKKKPSQITEQDMLLDLMGDSGMAATDSHGTINGSQSNNADLLADILGGNDTGTSRAQAGSPVGNAQGNMNSIMDLFGSQPAQSPSPAPMNDMLGGAQPPHQTHAAYNKNDLSITFNVQRSAQAVQVLARFHNTSNFDPLSALNLQAAVPKTQKLQLQAISSSELQGGQEATQQMRITSVQGVSC
jgi:AP-1 complex subunit gamma-1